MNILGLCLGGLFVLMAILMSHLGVIDVSQDASGIITFMLLCTGAICLAIGGVGQWKK